jgi:hypothetical protein
LAENFLQVSRSLSFLAFARARAVVATHVRVLATAVEAIEYEAFTAADRAFVIIEVAHTPPIAMTAQTAIIPTVSTPATTSISVPM